MRSRTGTSVQVRLAEEEKEHFVDFILKTAVAQVDKAVQLQSYAMKDGADVVRYVKVGSPALAIGQHRNCHTIRITAGASAHRPKSE